jgi:MoxR-like ATPase
MTIETPATRLNAFTKAVEAVFPERQAEIRCLMFGLTMRQHVLLLGPPGTAKSLLTRAFCEAIQGSYFEVLMGKYTVPEEVFGPFKLSALKEDRYERAVDGYLPSVEVAFVDEVYKANSAILNGMLTILNERKFRNGTKSLLVPLAMCVGASNELPEDDGLEALHDRFLFRRWVSYIKDEDAFGNVWDTGVPAIPVKIDPADLDAIRVTAAAVDTKDVKDTVVKLRAKLSHDHGIIVSDRRWMQLRGAIQMSAALAGRAVATKIDCLCLADALWSDPDQQTKVENTLALVVSPDLAEARRLFDALLTEYSAINMSFPNEAEITKAGKINRALREGVERLESFDQSGPVAELTAKLKTMHRACKQAVATAQGLD